jgi:hypothetical protein
MSNCITGFAQGRQSGGIFADIGHTAVGLRRRKMPLPVMFAIEQTKTFAFLYSPPESCGFACRSVLHSQSMYEEGQNMPFTVCAGRHAIATAVLLAGAGASAAAAPPEALDALSISIGDYIVSPSASLSVNTQYGVASSGDISSHEIHVPRVKVDFLLGNSQGLALDYYGFYRKYTDTWSRSFAVGQTGVNIVGTATADVGLDVANASYRWWFGHESDVFGVGVGVAYYRIRLGVNGDVFTNINNAVGTTSANYSADAVAPLVQLDWRHAFSPDTRMYVSLSGVERGNGNLNGHIYNAAIGAEWYFTKNMGFGAEYSATRVKINADDNNETLDLKMNGPSVFFKARF